jgi:hypothetical protein
MPGMCVCIFASPCSYSRSGISEHPLLTVFVNVEKILVNIEYFVVVKELGSYME